MRIVSPSEQADTSAARKTVLRSQPMLSRRDFLFGLITAGASATSASLLRHGVSTSHPKSANTIQFSTPIEHVIIAIRENHSYDNIFGLYPGGNGLPAGVTKPQCANSVSPDPGHTHTHAILALDSSAATSPQSDCVYFQEDVCGYWDLAQQFTLCDNYYVDILGPSAPNHLLLASGRAVGVESPSSTWTCPNACFDFPTLADRATQAGLTWKQYGNTLYDILPMIEHLQGNPNLVDNSYFTSDITAGLLPNVAWFKSYDSYSEHPPHPMHENHDWFMQRVNTFLTGPQWQSSLMIIVWDDWGGFYDHVRPPDVETFPGTNDQWRYGYRSGCLLVSPYAKSNYISHTLYSHASILALVEALFNLPPLTDLDAHANNMLDCFDFNQPPIQPYQVCLVGERQGSLGQAQPAGNPGGR